MRPSHPSPHWALGTAVAGAAFVLGGALVAWRLNARGSGATAPGSHAASPQDATWSALEGAVRDLTRSLEAARAQGTLAASDPLHPAETGGGRSPAAASGEESPSQGDALVAALDRLSRALEANVGHLAPGGIGITPLTVPRTARRGAVAALAGRTPEENADELRFSTFQQILDRFGRPDEVQQGDVWVYHLTDDPSSEVVTMTFSQGYLVQVWN